jgi:hypothetical protein
MPASLELLPKFAPIVARHFSAYLDLFADDASELGTHMARRMVAMIVALLALSFTLAMACVWILSAVWDTPWRQFGIASLLLVFAIGTVVAWFVAVRKPEAEWSPFHRLRSEWTLDEQLIAELMEGKHEEAAAENEVSRATVNRSDRSTIRNDRQGSRQNDKVSHPVKDYAS